MRFIKRRLDRLEEKAGRGKEPMCLVGIEGDPRSEKAYQCYLTSGIPKPFIWIDTGIRRSLDVNQPTSGEDDK